MPSPPFLGFFCWTTFSNIYTQNIQCTADLLAILSDPRVWNLPYKWVRARKAFRATDLPDTGSPKSLSEEDASIFPWLHAYNTYILVYHHVYANCLTVSETYLQRITLLNRFFFKSAPFAKFEKRGSRHAQARSGCTNNKPDAYAHYFTQ